MTSSNNDTDLSEDERELFERLLKEQGGEFNAFPLSFAQQRLWFLHQLYPDSPAYNISSALRLRGNLNPAALEMSFNEVVRRHEALRTCFATAGGAPVQVIAPAQPFVLPVTDLSAYPASQIDDEVKRRATNEAQQPFDLLQVPLLRARLLRLGDEDYVLLFTMSHIISDGWSIGILMRELSALYDAFNSDRPSPLPELPIQYADFASWQREWLVGEALEEHLSYWKNQLAGAPPVLGLLTDRPLPVARSFRGAMEKIRLSAFLTTALKELSRREEVTLYMTLLAAFKTLLFRYTGQQDIVVGSPIANRDRAEIEGLIGFFANMLALRTDLSGNPTFCDLLARVKKVATEAYAYKELPFERLVELLQPERQLSQTPLFQVVLTLENAPKAKAQLRGVSLSQWEFDVTTAKFDLTLHMIEAEQELVAALEYSAELFDGDTINRMLRHFESLLKAIVSGPERRISDLAMLTQAERRKITEQWNDTATGYPRHSTIHEQFQSQVERTPDKVAIEFQKRQLTYRRLNALSNQLARRLRALAVGPDAPVTICMERSLEMIVGILAVLKAGAAYVPLDPAYPAERLAFMLEDTRAPVLLTQQSLLNNLPVHAPHTICLDSELSELSAEDEENLPFNARADNLAYVMYTSGSIGRPKGVSVPHRGVVRLVKQTNYVRLDAEETFLQLAPVSFDASTLEIWGSLLNGGRLVIAPPHALSLEDLGNVIESNNVSTLWLTSGLLNQMVESRLESLRRVRQLLAGGDVLSVAHVDRILQELEETTLINGYGPTENTTFTCCFEVNASDGACDSVPIGRPIANTRVYILDSSLAPVPVGAPGELYIGGDGLARGYLNNPALTAEKFIPDPMRPVGGERLYKSGDRVRYLSDGTIEFLGRIDNQVKIRGFRIEPGEIEAVLSQREGIRDAVVIASKQQTGDKRLIAYLVAEGNGAPGAAELRAYLKEKLPEYMTVSAFIFLDAMPLTPNGKVDRRALPDADNVRIESEAPYAAPTTEVERAIAAVWQEALRVEKVGLNDNFFDIGGHSLLMIQIHGKLRA
ncbi:MAG: non-ribosomal peptide synthetase, partial [Blastocatellia bacterium]